MFGKRLLSRFLRHAWSNINWSDGKTDVEYLGSHDKDEEKETSKQKFLTYKHQATVQLQHNLVLFNKISTLQLNVTGKQVGPGYVELYVDSAFGRLCIIQTVTPIQPMVQQVIHTCYAPRLISPFVKVVFFGECLQFQKD